MNTTLEASAVPALDAAAPDSPSQARQRRRLRRVRMTATIRQPGLMPQRYPNLTVRI